MDWKDLLHNAIPTWKKLLHSDRISKTISKELIAIEQDLNDPPMIMVAGEFKAGKSTFINAWLGDKILTADVTPATAVVTKLTYGKSKKIIGHFQNGDTKQYDEQWLEQLTAEREGRFSFVRKQLSYIEIQIPNEQLKQMTIVDSPGLNADIEHHTHATEMFMSRADHMIWLFNYQFFGTSTEEAELKKMNQLGMTPIGVVNRIDLHDEEEEPLDEFLDSGKRRFQALISDLIGVSAKEALEGKLEQNQSKLRWSNWAAVEKVFESLKTAENIKPLRMFERLKEPLKKQDQIWIDQKADVGFYQIEPFIEPFLTNDFPNLLAQKQIVEDRMKELLEEIRLTKDEEAQLFTVNSINELATRMVAVQIEETRTYWENIVLPKYKQYENELRSFTIKCDELLNKERHLLNMWDGIASALFWGKGRINKFKAERVTFNKEVTKLEDEQKYIKKIHQGLVTALCDLALVHQEASRKPLDELVGKEEKYVKAWNKQFEQVRVSYQLFDGSQLLDVAEYLARLEQWINGMEPVFSDSEIEIKKLESFQESQYIYQNSKELYVDLPIEQVIEEYHYLKKFKPFDLSEHKIMIGQESLTFSNLIPEDKNRIPSRMTQDVHTRLAILSKRQRVVNSIGIVAVVFFAVHFAYSEGVFEPEENEQRFYTAEQDIEPEIVLAEEELDPTLEAKWPRENVEHFIYSMSEELSNNLNGYGEFYEGTWFEEEGWQSYYPHFDQISYGYLTGFTIKTIEYLDEATIVVVTEEEYEEGEIVTIFQGEYTLSLINESDLAISFSRHTVTEVIEPDYQIDTNELAYFLSDFRSAYLSALNHEDFSYISHFLAAEGSAYHSLQEYIVGISGQGYWFDFTDFQVVAIENVGKNQYAIDTFEQFLFYENDQPFSYKKEKRYIIKIRDTTTFEIEQIDELNSESEKLIVRTVDSVSTYEIDQFMNHYYNDFREAFNRSGFYYVESYYHQESSEYEETQAYIANANEKEMYMETLSFSVNGIWEYDDTHYIAELLVEDSYSYRDGTGDRKQIAAEYLINVGEDGTLKIVDVPKLDILYQEDIEITEDVEIVEEIEVVEEGE